MHHGGLPLQPLAAGSAAFACVLTFLAIVNARPTSNCLLSTSNALRLFSTMSLKSSVKLISSQGSTSA